MMHNNFYTDSENRKWQKIFDMRLLSRAMTRKYGANWKESVKDTYGKEQLGLI